MYLNKTKILILVIIGFIFGAVALPIISCDEPLSKGTIYVDDDRDSGWYDASHVRTIQEGIDNSSLGDTIFVYNGTYSENIIINHTLEINGENKTNTIIDGNGNNAITISDNYVNLSNFTIINSGDYWIEGWDSVAGNASIMINANNISIENTIIENSSCAIFIDYGINISLENNQMNKCGIFIDGSQKEHFNTHSIPTSNLVNGKSVKFFKNHLGFIDSTNAGQIILVNCSGIVIMDYSGNYNNATIGILIAYSKNIQISDCESSYNIYGVRSFKSESITLYGSVTYKNHFQHSQYGVVYRNTTNNHMNGGANYIDDNEIGIYLINSNNTEIDNNFCMNNTYEGIYLRNCDNNTISNNNCSYSMSGRGINIDDGDNNTVVNNICLSTYWNAIFLGYSKNNTIENNIASSTTYSSIYLFNSVENKINNNFFSNNGQFGILLIDNNNYNIITNNTCLNNGFNGISLFKSDYNDVTYNKFNNNNYGVYLGEYSEFNAFRNNSIQNNSIGGLSIDRAIFNEISNNKIINNSGYGIELSSLTNNNVIFNNIFSNFNNAYDLGNNKWNMTKQDMHNGLNYNIIGGDFFGGNYWSDYTGIDTDNDGIGDTNLPYNCSGNITNGGDYLPLISLNNPPNQPILNYPSNGSTNISISPILNITVSDPNGDILDVSFYQSLTDSYDDWWNSSFKYRKEIINETQSDVAVGLNGTNGLNEEIIWVNPNNRNLSIYYNNMSDFSVVENNSIAIPYEIERTGLGYNTSYVYDETAYAIYHFGENSKLNDSTGNNEPMVNYSAQWSPYGKYGGSWYFSGNYLVDTSFSFAPGNDDFTISAWVKVPTTGFITEGSEGWFVDTHGTHNWYDDRVALGIMTDGRIRFRTNQGSSNNRIDTIGPQINDSSWHFIVGVRESGIDKLYVDGILVDTSTDSNNIGSGGKLTIGCSAYNTYSRFVNNTYIDEVRLYDGKALTFQEINEFHNNSLNNNVLFDTNQESSYYLGTLHNLTNDSLARFNWDGLFFNTTYHWYVEITDGCNIIKSPIWTFTTEIDYPPNQPILNYPLNGSIGISTSPILNISVSDPNGDNLNVSFYSLVNNCMNYWSLDRTIKDFVGHNHGHIPCQPTWVNGIDHDGVYFDGSGDNRFEINSSTEYDNSTFDNFSISWWYYARNGDLNQPCTNNMRTMVWFTDTGIYDTGFVIYLDTDFSGFPPYERLRIWTNSDTFNINDPDPDSGELQEEKWYLFTITYNKTSKNFSFYTNGILIDYHIISEPLNISQNSFPLVFAHQYGLGGNAMGIFDEIMIFNDSLTSETIIDLYNQNNKIHTSNNNTSNSDVTFNWCDLSFGEKYKWFAKISDRNAVTIGPIWSFETHYKPIADFTYLPLEPTTIDTIIFSDDSYDDGYLINWTWDFGDGSGSYEQHPTHQYTNSGNYTISLNITDNNGASDEMCKQLTVIPDNPPIQTIEMGSLIIEDVYYTGMNWLDLIGSQTPMWINSTDIETGTEYIKYKLFQADVFGEWNDPPWVFVYDNDYTGNPYTTDIDPTVGRISIMFSIQENCFHEIHAHCIDTMGNWNYSTPLDFLVDSEGPSNDEVAYINFYQGPGGARYMNNQSIKRIWANDTGCTGGVAGVKRIDWRIEDSTTVTIASGIVNDNNITVYEDEYVVVSGDFDMTVGKMMIEISLKQEGIHFIYHQAIDNLENQESGRKQLVYVDLNPPVIQNMTISPDIPFVNQQVQISAHIVDSYCGVDLVTINLTGPGGASSINESMLLNIEKYQYEFIPEYPGLYTYFIWTKDHLNHSKKSTTMYFTVFQKPTADFTYSPLEPNIGENVTFQDSSNDVDGNITSWSWTFGDGGSSIDQNPTHDYDSSGRFSVTLTVEDDDGFNNSITKLVPVGLDLLYVQDLSGGWNFVSLPFNESVDKTDFLLKYDDCYYGLNDGIINPFMYGWNRAGQYYSFANTFNPGFGYWVFAYEDCELWIEELTPNSDDYITTMESGWNVIGLPFDQTIEKVDVIVRYYDSDHTWSQAVTDGFVVNFVYGWNRPGQYYEFANTFYPGYSYWVYASQSCMLKRDA